MTEKETKKQVIVVGGGLAGLSAAMKLAELDCHVKIVSVTKVKRSHSVCAQGGINAAMNTMGEKIPHLCMLMTALKEVISLPINLP